MRSRLLAALSAAALLVTAATAHAEGVRRHGAPRPLPPVSGTLHMTPDDFGRGQPQGASRRTAAQSETVQVVRGGLFPRDTVYRAITPAERWATGGTGVSGLIGNTGNPYAGETQWGTADSATTGVARAPRFGWQRRGLLTSEPSLVESYGEPPAYAGVSYDGPAYGATPQLSYYSSGSSAGPYGSPGGLATYRSGSYGYGPRIIRVGTTGRGWRRQGCTCGPRILHLRRHSRTYSAR